MDSKYQSSMPLYCTMFKLLIFFKLLSELLTWVSIYKKNHSVNFSFGLEQNFQRFLKCISAIFAVHLCDSVFSQSITINSKYHQPALFCKCSNITSTRPRVKNCSMKKMGVPAAPPGWRAEDSWWLLREGEWLFSLLDCLYPSGWPFRHSHIGGANWPWWIIFKITWSWMGDGRDCEGQGYLEGGSRGYI